VSSRVIRRLSHVGDALVATGNAAFRKGHSACRCVSRYAVHALHTHESSKTERRRVTWRGDRMDHAELVPLSVNPSL
jgi:hypothetical protein